MSINRFKPFRWIALNRFKPFNLKTPQTDNSL